MFGVRLTLAERYAALLAAEGDLRGLIGPRELPRLWERHLLNCAIVADAIPGPARVADVGSGAGLPGLVLAIRRPDLELTLIEPMARRSDFLREAVESLGLANVRVLRARAEDATRTDPGCRDFDVVTSRAVAPLDRLARWSMPLVAPGGAMLAMKGSSAAEEVAGHERALRRLGVGSIEVLSLGSGLLEMPVTVVRARRGAPSGTAKDRQGRARDKGER